MKKVFCILICLALFLTGCVASRNRTPSVRFYYLQSDYQSQMHHGAQGVMACEERETSISLTDYEKILSLYLAGTLEETMISPFPSGTKLLSLSIQEQTLYLSVSEQLSALDNTRFTIACACLALTALELTELTQVVIQTNKAAITLSRESLLLWDTGISE